MVEKVAAIGIGSKNDSVYEMTIPYPETNSLDDVLVIVEKALSKGNVKKLVIEAGKPILLVLTEEAEEEEDTEPILLDEIVRSKEIVPLSGPFSSPMIAIGSALSALSEERLVGCFILANSRQHISDWYVGKKGSAPLRDIMGLGIHEAPSIPADVAIICGSMSRVATPLDIVKCYQIYLDRSA